MDARGSTDFEQAVACAMRSPIGVGSARFHTGGEPGPADTVYLGVFRRSALERVGGYDAHFARAQDWEMNHRIRESGGTVWFTPELRVTYRPRASVKALAKQYFHYGRWRRVVARHHEGTINPRYLAPPTMVVVTTAATVAGFLWAPAWAVPAAYAVGRRRRRRRHLAWRVRPHPRGDARRARDDALGLGRRIHHEPAPPDPLTRSRRQCATASGPAGAGHPLVERERCGDRDLPPGRRGADAGRCRRTPRRGCPPTRRAGRR